MLGYITDPTAPGGLDRRDLPAPEPTPHQAVIEVAAYAVNRGELALLAQRASGWTPGQDLAGVVLAAAADGTGPAVGERVVGMADWGGWSERVAVPTHRIAPLPASVTFPQAAALPVAGLTALRALRTGGPLLGRRVLVTGASGGVGSFAVQLALAAGAAVTAQVSGPSRIEQARALGADGVVTEIGEDSGPFDLVLDGVGGSVLVDAIHRLAVGGRVTAYGLAGGERSQLAFSDFREATPGATLQGFFVYRTGEETFGEDLAILARMVADGRLHPLLGVVREWSHTVEAVDALRSRQATGKVVLTLR
ncbi:MAG TPA: zinc-binding dehydrogenase [Actinomycetota bacterium]|jgi:NADPH:quinone reductase-like Zn-dependent oxidoreductase|nr:zinc-binding dehydrogenase [Actinomycetota bacterium]